MLIDLANKITYLGAQKVVLGAKRFVLYIAFMMAFSFVMGLRALSCQMDTGCLVTPKNHENNRIIPASRNIRGRYY